MIKHMLAAALLLSVSLAASAHDLTLRIKALNGEDIPVCADGKADCGKFMTVADAATFALLNAPDEGRPGEPAKGDQKMQRFLLASKIQQNPHVILTADDVSLIEKVVSQAFGPLIVGRVYQSIDAGQAVKK